MVVFAGNFSGTGWGFGWPCWPHPGDFQLSEEKRDNFRQTAGVGEGIGTFCEECCVACVASVSVWFRSKKRQRNEIFGFWPRGKWNESQKMKEGRGEGRKRLQTSPSILKTCVRQRTQRVIGSASRTILICVDQRFVSYWEVVYGTWHARCDCCLVWSARFALQCKSVFFDLF